MQNGGLVTWEAFVFFQLFFCGLGCVLDVDAYFCAHYHFLFFARAIAFFFFWLLLNMGITQRMVSVLWILVDNFVWLINLLDKDLVGRSLQNWVNLMNRKPTLESFYDWGDGSFAVWSLTGCMEI